MTVSLRPGWKWEGHCWFSICGYVVAVYILKIHQFGFPFGVKPEIISQFRSELTSEYLFDLTTATATAVPNTDKGIFACSIFCTPREAGTRTESGSDNTFVGQNSPFFLFFSLLSSLFFINYF